MSFLELRDVSKTFGSFNAVNAVNITAEKGEFLVLVGPSGCGKTTLLRMIAGLEQTSSGSITIDGKNVTDEEPGDRDVAMVFQNYALFPHMTVSDNISFGMRMSGRPKAEVEDRVNEAARFLQLSELLTRKPAELSGGQRQRVAMGRAIVRRPNAFLMDEPLSNLDANLRVQMRGEVLKIQRELGVTTVYVTHDQVEAMTMADRVAVLHKGLLMQIASPTELYDEPQNVFVAGFLGSPPMSFAAAKIGAAEGGAIDLHLGAQVIRLEGESLSRYPDLASYSGKDVALGIRPEDIKIVGTEAIPGNYVALDKLPGKVTLSEMLGAEEVVYVDAGLDPVSSSAVVSQLNAVAPMASGVGDEADAEPKAILVSRSGRRDKILQAGNSVTLALDPSRIHLFDWTDGRTLRS